MSKSSDLSKTMKRYIIECIDADGYDVPEPETDAEKIQFLKDTFYSEKDWHIKQVGEQKALEDWFRGLPSSCNISFSNYDILQLAVKWGSLPEDYLRSQAEKILENYWNLIAAKTSQMFRWMHI